MSHGVQIFGPVSKAAFWTGWVLTVLPAPLFVMSAVMKFLNPPDMAEQFATLGWPDRYALGLGILEISCVMIYLIPRTAVLGAILLTGYLGGAIATHIRVGDFMILPHVGLGIAIWLGLFLRDPRLRALAPVRS